MGPRSHSLPALLLFVLLAGCGARSPGQGNCTKELSLIQFSRKHTLQARSRDFSALRSRREGCAGGDCVVPAGETWVLDASMDVDTLTIEGTLTWDTTKDGLELRAGFVMVADGGRLIVGTKEQPMEKRATIYIKKGQTNEDLGTRFLGGLGSGKIDIHGRRLQRTWTLLSKTAVAGERQLYLKDDPEAMGWRVGDRIGLATTSRGESTVHTIAAIAEPDDAQPGCDNLLNVKKTCSANRCRVLAGSMTGKTCDHYCGLNALACAAAFEEMSDNCDIKAVLGCNETWAGTSDLICECTPPAQAQEQAISAGGQKVLHLVEPLRDEHWGGVRNVAGRELEMAAEVVNLDRSVLITGDHDDFYMSNKGLHTIMTGTGYIDMRYTRVEYCGQRDVMGRYCLHFHLLKKCPRCVFEGNSVVDSAQVGITIHGTHDALISNNVVWNARAVGIYTEDGNEMNNLIKQNVVICTWWQTCSVNWITNVGLHAGIFLIGMTNDLIENRVAGHENCIWTPGGARGAGHGQAEGKVCPMYTPFGEIRGNVNHDCQRFGLYLDNQFPRNVKRDEDGYVVDRASCQKFTADGSDNGLQPPNVIKDEFDWHNMFVGMYNLGDVQFVNYISANNAHALYWKSSKNFADGRLWHIKDSLILNDPNDPIGRLQFLGPGGPHVFGIQNTVFAGGPTVDGVLCAGQHCGLGIAGGPCVSQYLLEGVDFSGVMPGQQLIEFGVHSTDPGEVLPIFVAKDNSLAGHRSMVSSHLNGFGLVSGCSRLGSEWSSGYGCSVPIRRLNVWGPDVGDLMLSGPGYEVSANEASPALGMNAGRMIYEPLNGKAYGAPVLVGGEYTLSGAWQGDMVLDFSDDVLADYFGSPNEQVRLEVRGTACSLHASDDRRFLSPKGPVPRILETHTRIVGGSFLCGGSSGEAPSPSVSVCSVLTSVVETCSADSCKVLAGGMLGRTCASYCQASALFCLGAWEPTGDGCAAATTESQLCGDPPTSDRWICQCGPEEAGAPPSTTAAPAETTVLPPDEEVSAPDSGTKSPQASVCAALPDVKASCSDDGCKVLAGGMTGLTCLEYCARSGMECAGAWEEVSNDCNVKETLSCSQVRPGTSDLICECATALTTTPSAGPADGSAAEPPPPPPAASQTECNLPDVKEFCTSSGCKVLAGSMLDRTCGQYCSENGLVCVGAGDDEDDTCREVRSLRCDESVPRTTDLICECGTAQDVATFSTPSPATTRSPATTAAPLGRAWVHHKGYNCFGGLGAVGVPGKSPIAGGDYVPSTCKAACEAEPECEGIVMVRDFSPYKCWLVQDLNPKTCLKNTDYDLWEVVLATQSEDDAVVSALDPSPTAAPAPAPSSSERRRRRTSEASGRRRTSEGGQVNVYEHATSGVGGWGGWCTCPDGQRYNVGDLFDGCANGPQSLACFGGTPGECVKVVEEERRGMRVTCAEEAAGPSDQAAGPSGQMNVYVKTVGVGGWGGWCTCPDGQRYNVGDVFDGCASGPQSLACFGGTPGECVKTIDESRKGMRVTCAAEPGQVNVYEHATSGVGGWGGWCTCPDGQRYNVGDMLDGCANGPQSLACFGGIPGECAKVVEESRKGMLVTCAQLMS